MKKNVKKLMLFSHKKNFVMKKKKAKEKVP